MDSNADGFDGDLEGGALAHLSIETFRLDVDVTAPPGLTTLDTLLLYPSRATVSWPATLTVVPGQDDEQTQGVAWALIAATAGAGLSVAIGVIALAWRRKAPSS